MIEMPAW